MEQGRIEERVVLSITVVVLVIATTNVCSPFSPREDVVPIPRKAIIAYPNRVSSKNRTNGVRIVR